MCRAPAASNQAVMKGSPMADESVTQKKPYPKRACWDLPASKRCTKCGEVKAAAHFKIRQYKTSTGRDSRKLHSMCDPCRKTYELEKSRKHKPPKGTPKGLPPHPVDQPKRCSGCREVKTPTEFGRINNGKSLASRCKLCLSMSRKPQRPEKVTEYVQRRRELERSSPELMAAKKKYAADFFQANKERIRIRNLATRRLNPTPTRARSSAATSKRRSKDPTCRLSETRAAIEYTLESYRIGDEYWDVYSSELIKTPTVDHLTAIFRDGTNAVENLTVTSLANNSSKGVLPLLVWLAKRAARTRQQQ